MITSVFFSRQKSIILSVSLFNHLFVFWPVVIVKIRLNIYFWKQLYAKICVVCMINFFGKEGIVGSSKINTQITSNSCVITFNDYY